MQIRPSSFNDPLMSLIRIRSRALFADRLSDSLSIFCPAGRWSSSSLERRRLLGRLPLAKEAEVELGVGEQLLVVELTRRLRCLIGAGVATVTSDSGAVGRKETTEPGEG